jgi:hypothetical protein
MELKCLFFIGPDARKGDIEKHSSDTGCGSIGRWPSVRRSVCRGVRGWSSRGASDAMASDAGQTLCSVQWLHDISSFFESSCAPDVVASIDPPSDAFDVWKLSLDAYWSASDARRRTLSARRRTHPMLAETTIRLWMRETHGEIWCTGRYWVRPMPVRQNVRCPQILPDGSIWRGILYILVWPVLG